MAAEDGHSAGNVGTQHSMGDELLKELFERLLVGDVQKQLNGKVWVEPVGTRVFHGELMLPERKMDFNHKWTNIRTFDFTNRNAMRFLMY